MTLIARLVAVAAATVALSSAASAQNLVVNGDFEAGNTGWTVWQVTNSFWNGSWIQSNDCDIWVPNPCPFAGSGSHAQKKGSGAGNAHGGLYQVVNVTPGARYRVGGYWSGGVFGNAGGNDTWWEVVVFDGVVDDATIDAGTRPQDAQIAKRTRGGLAQNEGFQFNWEPFGGEFVARSPQVTLVLKTGSFFTFDAAAYHDQVVLAEVRAIPVDAPWALALAAFLLAAGAATRLRSRARG